MKSLIIIALTIASFNVLAADKKVVGEDKKGECQFGPQSNRSPKVVSSTSSEQKKVETKATISK